MFIKVTHSGSRRYAQLVESFRNEAGQPRQRTVCTLGRLEPGGEVDALINALQRARGVQPRNEPSAASAAIDPLQNLRFVDSCSVGDVWALWQLWRALGLDELALAWRRSRSEIDVLACLRAMVFNRLCDPQSKLGVLRWLETVALPVNFGFAESAPAHQELLRAMDVLDLHSAALGTRLATLMRPLIDEDLSVVFYDLTTVQVSGEAEVAGDVRAFGQSKSGLVARQFVLSLVQTAEGLPIAHEVHPGNVAESKTLLPMIRGLLSRYPLKRVVLVADRGLLSVNNLQELAQLEATLVAQGRAVKLEYVLAVPATRYGDFADDLAKLAAQQPAAAEWVAQTKWEQRRLVVAHDPLAAQRRTEARRKATAELVEMGQQWGLRLDEQDAGARHRGRPLTDSGAKARFFHAVKEAQLAHLIKVDMHSQAFSFSIDEERQRYLELLDGKLLLVTNTEAPAAEVVQRYKSLADIERGFRVLKSDIEIGPVYHRLPKRIRAHALVCFLALLLHRVMRMRLKAGKREESPTRLLEQLRRIHRHTVKTAEGKSLSGLTEMTPQQRSLFTALELPIPTPQEIAKAVL